MSQFFALAEADGVFGNIVNSPEGNDTSFTFENWTTTRTGNPLLPPVCESVVPDAPLPVLDDVGCLGATMSWIFGLRGFESTSVWFTILFIVPPIIAGLIFAMRLLRGN